MDEAIPLHNRRSLSPTSVPPYESRPSSPQHENPESNLTSTVDVDADERDREPDLESDSEPYDLPPPDGTQSPKPPSYCEVPPQTPAIPLRRSRWGLLVAVCYILPVCFSWIVLCLLRTRPLSIGTYEFTGKDFYYRDKHHYRNAWAANERWYSAATVIQSIMGVLTIPAASAICGYASVVYAQRNRISLRKLLVLADRGYANPRQLWSGADPKNLPPPTASRFFVLAMLVHLIGVLIWPLQIGLVSTKVVNVPTDDTADAYLYKPYSFSVLDLNDLSPDKLPSSTTFTAPSALRGMQQISEHAFEPHLWQPGRRDFAALGSMSNPTADSDGVDDYFYSQMPVGYNTGAIRQNAPRVNSSAEMSCVDEFPQECDNSDAVSVTYHDENNNIDYGSRFWYMRLCIPPNSTASPWTATRDRQDFQETLYLNVSTYAAKYRSEKKCIARVDLKTTAGLFELPNYMNDGKPGPLMEKDPDKSSAQKRQ